jgi:hypothetical protein
LDIQVAPTASVASLAADIQRNTTLTKLNIDRTSSREATTDGVALKEMKEFLPILANDNLILKEFHVGQWDTATIREAQEHFQAIDFYLTLNRYGRHRLISDPEQTATQEDWLDAVANRDDPSVIFYFIQKNPSICRYTPSGQSPVNSRSNGLFAAFESGSNALFAAFGSNPEARQLKPAPACVSPEGTTATANTTGHLDDEGPFPAELDTTVLTSLSEPSSLSPMREHQTTNYASPCLTGERSASSRKRRAESSSEEVVEEETQNLPFSAGGSVFPFLTLGILNGAMFAAGYSLGKSS